MSADTVRRQRPASFWVRRCLLYLLLAVVALGFVGPFVLLLSTAMKPETQSVYGFPPSIVPLPPVFDWFVDAWTLIPFARMLLNSVLYVVITIPLYLLVSAMTAWPLARMRFRGRGVFFILFLSLMFMPAEIMLVPRFLVMSQLDLTDSYTAVILVALLSSLGVFLLRQTFAEMPGEIIEAARIDGANEWGIFWRIALPITKPTMAVLAILGFISVWNSFIWPLVVLTTQDKFPIALGIAYLTGVTGTDMRGLAAGTVMSLVPVIAIFIVLQRRILSSMGGAVKG
ncbi:carbohydrate ABC transporter permease [Ruania zhangjianzhongii]|uniref:carbohydrate ABC transporter permease n=1 Tax=Ruania zhangjianzhongii TaxID=2603206 RepID=UPI0011C78CD9|nr:carbohydrate ABC transporter permease [Ruania zhangjianzhongii]